MCSTLAIDFGSSNCTAFVPNKTGNPTMVPLEGDRFILPNVIFAKKANFTRQPINQDELQRRIIAEKRTNINNLNIALIRKNIEIAMENEEAIRVENLYANQTFKSMIENGNALFGTPAINAFFEDPTAGILVRSAKSFLGGGLNLDLQIKIQLMITSMLSYIKEKAEAYTGRGFSRVLLGRPVNYQNHNQINANNKAIDLMTEAAKSAGFEEIEFYLEPVAAALNYERTLTEEKTVLVIDIGGGTTDCTVMKLGPNLHQNENRENDILMSNGIRIGGADFDEAFALSQFMTLFGKSANYLINSLPVPNQLFIDAISVRDFPSQIRFNESQHAISNLINQTNSPESFQRLEKLRFHLLQHRLIYSVEATKIALSNNKEITTNLDFIEANLSKTTTLTQLEKAFDNHLNDIRILCEESLNGTPIQPDEVFITGGMSFSPFIRNKLSSLIKNSPPVRFGNEFNVGMGLGLRASI